MRTGAPASARVAQRPPKPPPITMTCGVVAFVTWTLQARRHCRRSRRSVWQDAGMTPRIKAAASSPDIPATAHTRSRIRAGTGGWTYGPWRDNFYPAGLVQRLELEYAS